MENGLDIVFGQEGAEAISRQEQRKLIEDRILESAVSDFERQEVLADKGVVLNVEESDALWVPEGMVLEVPVGAVKEDLAEHEDVSFAVGQFADLAEGENRIGSLEEADLVVASGEQLDERGNPLHGTDGKFASKKKLNTSATGSFSYKGRPKHKSKVKNGKRNGNPAFVKTPLMCGRPARKKGMNVRCWTGRPFPEGPGRAAEHTKTKPRTGRGRGWRKGQSKKGRNESVEFTSEFKLDLREGEEKVWFLFVGDRSAEVVESDSGYDWTAIWTDETGEEQTIGFGNEEFIEDAWSNAADEMGVFLEESEEELEEGVSFSDLKGGIYVRHPFYSGKGVVDVLKGKPRITWANGDESHPQKGAGMLRKLRIVEGIDESERIDRLKALLN